VLAVISVANKYDTFSSTNTSRSQYSYCRVSKTSILFGLSTSLATSGAVKLDELRTFLSHRNDKHLLYVAATSSLLRCEAVFVSSPPCVNHVGISSRAGIHFWEASYIGLGAFHSLT